MNRTILAFTVLLTMVFAACRDQDSTAKLESGPKVLIITPQPEDGYGPGIEELLRKHGLATRLVSWGQATEELAGQFDVLIVTGVGRYPATSEVRLDFKKPVLAYGPYGCGYLGCLQLKNGHPYT
jgi:hypothetical protein